jgi:hypothetical protein
MPETKEKLLTIGEYAKVTPLTDKEGRPRKGKNSSWIYKTIREHVLSKGETPMPFQYRQIGLRFFIVEGSEVQND